MCEDPQLSPKNFISVPPLNESFEENLKAFEKLFRKTSNDAPKMSVPENAEIMAIDNLVFLHTKVLPIPVYVELKIEFDKKAYSKLQQQLLQYFIRGWVIQIRPFTLKTIPGHGQMFLGVICMVPYFKMSTIKETEKGDFDIDKSEIKYIFCRGTQLLALFQENVCSILGISHKDPLMPKRRSCRHYTELNVFHNYTLKNLLNGCCEGATKTLIDTPWISLDRNSILQQINNNRNNSEVQKLTNIWPLTRISCPINDKIWEKPSSTNSSGDLISMCCISTIKDNTINTLSVVFPISDTIPYWVSTKPTLEPPNKKIIQKTTNNKQSSETPKPQPKRTGRTSSNAQRLKKKILVSSIDEHKDTNEIPFTVEREFSL